MISESFYNSLPNFDQYYQHIKDLFAAGKTTGNNQSEQFLKYTQLTLARTKRGLKTLHPSRELVEITSKTSKTKWFVITEAWCGDAGNIIPLIVNLSKQLNNIELKFIIRDEHPEIMNLFLTNGGRSIPIFVALDENMGYSSHWGPRPKQAQKMVINHKENPQLSNEDFQISLQKWYLSDNGKTLNQELIEYLRL